MADITAIILTRNEENYVGDCIKSIKQICNRIVVVDSFSTDKTEQICIGLGVEFYQHEFENYSKQYKYAVNIANVKTKWILKIDADERLSIESSKELSDLCNKYEDDDSVSGIIIRFVNMFMGKKIKHGGFYPWRKLSVYKAGLGDIEDRHMDEHIVLSRGKAIKAKKDGVHEYYRDLSFFINKHNWYSTREAMDYFENYNKKNDNAKTKMKMKYYYKTPSFFRAHIYFLYRYYIRLGFLDGKPGKIFHYLHAYWYRFLVDAKIYEHNHTDHVFTKTGPLK